MRKKHERLKTIEFVGLRIMPLRKLSNVFEQLGDLSRRPAVTSLISRNTIADRFIGLIYPQIVNGLKRDVLFTHMRRVFPVSSSCIIACLRLAVFSRRSSNPAISASMSFKTA